MSDIAIRADGLGKKYRIGGKQEGYRTLRDTLSEVFMAPFRRAKRLVSGQGYGAAEKGEMIWALKDVSFQIKRGEVVGVIGKNGAGKTTLLKILSRITEPTEGQAEIYGRVGSLLEVGTGFHHELTGRENIYLNGAILGMRKAEIEQKFDEIVDFAEIEKFIDTPVKHYSSGMYVRLAFAVAAHLEPEILLVDEVLAVGDASFQKKCLAKMGDVASEGRTILFVSHNMTAVQSLCNRVIWLHSGEVIEHGDADKTVMRYLGQGRQLVAEQSWDDPGTAPGSRGVRLKSIFIRPFPNKQGRTLLITQELEVGIEFWCLRPQHDLAITLHIVTHQGVVAFSTSSANHPSLREKNFDRGLYLSRCRIPADFLNNATYSIRLLMVKNQANVIFKLEEALVFEMLDSGGQQRGAYFGERPGVVAPSLTWDLEQLSDDSQSMSSWLSEDVSVTGNETG